VITISLVDFYWRFPPHSQVTILNYSPGNLPIFFWSQSRSTVNWPIVSWSLLTTLSWSFSICSFYLWFLNNPGQYFINCCFHLFCCVAWTQYSEVISACVIRPDKRASTAWNFTSGECCLWFLDMDIWYEIKNSHNPTLFFLIYLYREREPL